MEQPRVFSEAAQRKTPPPPPPFFPVSFAWNEASPRLLPTGNVWRGKSWSFAPCTHSVLHFTRSFTKATGQNKRALIASPKGVQILALHPPFPFMGSSFLQRKSWIQAVLGDRGRALPVCSTASHSQGSLHEEKSLGCCAQTPMEAQL